VFGSEGKGAGTDCQTLACALDVPVLHRNLKPNGWLYEHVAGFGALLYQNTPKLAVRLKAK